LSWSAGLADQRMDGGLAHPGSPPSPPQMPPSVFEQGGLFSPLAPLHLGMLGEEIPNDPGKMFVGGLSWQTTPEGVREYFSQFGDVAEVMVMKDPATRRSRGFGFITFTQAGSVSKVLSYPAHQLDGKLIEPKVAVPRKSNPKLVMRTKKIFVGGLSATTSLEDVKAYFEQFSKVKESMLAYDKVTNRHRGFGFVTFDNEDVVDKICEIHFHEINGKMVESKKALPKEPRGGLGGLGGLYSSLSPPQGQTSPSRFATATNNNNIHYNRYNMGQYYNNADPYDRYISGDSEPRSDNYSSYSQPTAVPQGDNDRCQTSSRFAGYFSTRAGNISASYASTQGTNSYNGNSWQSQRGGVAEELGLDLANLGELVKAQELRHGNYGGPQGSVSDYINTALTGHGGHQGNHGHHGNHEVASTHYETDFPELTSKFESFGLNSNEVPVTLPDLF